MDGITERTEERSRRERLVDLVCSFQPHLFYLFVIQGIFLMLALFSLAYIGPGATSYPVLQIDIFIIGTVLLITGLLLYHCNQRERHW